MVPKELKRALLYSTDKYHALINPDGVATHIGTPQVCLNIFHELRFKVVIIRDEDVARAHEALARSGWQIKPVKMAIFSEDLTVPEIEAIAKRPTDAVL